MPRFFTEEAVSPLQSRLALTGEDAHHIAAVLRMKQGDELVVCDGARTDLLCRIEQMTTGQIGLLVLERNGNRTEPGYVVTLYQGLVKGDKMDQIIQKAVELGVTEIVPVDCRRSVARVHESDREKKGQRWNRIAAEAAKQCGRGVRPRVADVQPFAACLSGAAAAGLALIPWEMEREQSIRSVLTSFQAQWDGQDKARQSSGREQPTISILIGPEGGLTETEVEQACAAGIRPVTLGRRILRTETAGPAALAQGKRIKEK